MTIVRDWSVWCIQVFLRRFRDPIRVPRISKRIREIGSLQI